MIFFYIHLKNIYYIDLYLYKNVLNDFIFMWNFIDVIYTIWTFNPTVTFIKYFFSKMLFSGVRYEFNLYQCQRILCVALLIKGYIKEINKKKKKTYGLKLSRNK